MNTIWAKLQALLRRDRISRELAEEAEAHFEMEVEANIERGMSEAKAREQAQRHFGNRTQIQEASREAWIFGPIEDFFHDLRYGWRNMRRSPAFTAIALLTLALGIGGNTVIFSAINGILIEHLPYARASQLLTVKREQSAWGITRDEARTIQERCPACERITIIRRLNLKLTVGDSSPEARWITQVSGEFFPLLGVSPLVGRYILPAEEQAGAQVAVLSYHLWMDAFRGDPNVVGREVAVDQASYSIVGVMPEKFEMGVNVWSEKDDGLWIPIHDERPGQKFDLIVRVRDGVSAAVARDQIQGASSAVASRFPAGAKHTNLIAEAPRRQIDREVRTGLLILQGAVAFVLLLASVNISSLLVARAWSRQREIGVRRALGASRLRIFRQLFSESLLLALAGGALGLLFSVWGIQILRALAPPGTPRLGRMQLDSNVLWFTLAISIFAAVLFGLMPAIQASANRGADGVRGGLNLAIASATLPRRRTFRSVLLVVEVALATVIVVGAGLMTRSFANLMGLDTGVRADHTLSMFVEFSETSCVPSCDAAAQTVLDRARSLPGVEHAAISAGGPFDGVNWRAGIQFDGSPVERTFSGVERIISSQFFEAAGMRILRGRDFVAADPKTAAIVSEDLARDYFQGNPLGKRFSTHKENGNPVWLEVVGVVNGTRNRAVTQSSPTAAYYVPLRLPLNRGQLLARTLGDPLTLAKPLQDVVRLVDKAAIIIEVRTLEQALSESAALPRFQASIFGAFGVLALVLATIGIFGVTSYSVQQRTKEIGIRMALGARVSQVMGAIVAQGAVLTLGGIGCGLAIAVSVSRFLESMLFGVPTVDTPTYAGVSALLLGAALLAFYLPARTAARVDPVQTLRHD